MKSSVAVMLLCASTCSGQLTPINSDAAFESGIISSTRCWAVLFVSSHRDVAAATEMVSKLGAMMPGLSLASADVDEVKAISSEFNVRKRMVPRLLIFSSRARQADIIKLKAEAGTELSFDEVAKMVRNSLAENSKDADGNYEKLTLAIGGAEDKAEL